MVQKLFVGRAERTFGPFSATQLREFAAVGKLRLTDRIWKQGQEQQGVAAARVRNLFPQPDPVQALLTVTPVLIPAEVDSTTQPHLVDTAVPAPDSFDNASSAALVPLNEEERTGVPPESSQQSVSTPVPPKAQAPAHAPEKQRLRRAIAVQGAILMGQDGVYVQFRKKCVVCGFEDTCRSNMLIGQGITRAQFFCRKCRKCRDVLIQGLMQ
jgi:hypothetical protein